MIDAYLTAHDEHRTDATLATFQPDATVVDDGATYTGRDAIRSWLGRSASEYTFTRHSVGAEQTGARSTSYTTTSVGTSPAVRSRCTTGSTSATT